MTDDVFPIQPNGARLVFPRALDFAFEFGDYRSRSAGVPNLIVVDCHQRSHRGPNIPPESRLASAFFF